MKLKKKALNKFGVVTLSATMLAGGVYQLYLTHRR